MVPRATRPSAGRRGTSGGVTYNFGLHFTQELGNSFGPPTDSWPASAEQVTPFFAIVVNVLGTDDAARWFEAARKAHQRVVVAERDRTHHFGFAHHLDVETEAHQEPTLPVVAAFEATKALYEITRRDSGVDVDVFFGCALRACSRGSGRTDSTPVAAGANA
ncbi:hypothetical protein AQJ43_37615 [Streptomyces avermitilis]|uniref:Uncharacterized protein n=1 Tax=Streptomyces avermitilis (strain ATCC 31267 / DSM 46492 / JCM 5070 / NBRC 14893 / NCIMB 12804 / NRRL 8165 / MA-4680) TaxID=227882 RepID=Q82YH7_STRAW|nr:hypothetical protein AQJ43_37615 [Streptomyces avermitilis]BAC75287.1 hypothetical protein SAVERM_1p03 [Streptomyces avermitilis MA-4680 = NBRC 14893]